MKNVKTLIVTVVLLFLATLTTQAQSCTDRLGGDCHITPGTGYSFGAAKAHDHGSSSNFQTITGYYCGRGLVSDSTNNEGNNFYGNTICVVDMTGSHWYWYDWSADSQVGEKIATWTNNYPYQWVSVTFDPVCGLGFSAVNPWTGGV